MDVKSTSNAEPASVTRQRANARAESRIPCESVIGRSASLPPVEVVDGLSQEAIASFIAHTAALQARAAARLGRPAADPNASISAANAEAQRGDGDHLLTAGEVAELLNAKPAWVYRHQHQLGGRKLDGLLRFSARRVQAYVERQYRMAV